MNVSRITFPWTTCVNSRLSKLCSSAYFKVWNQQFYGDWNIFMHDNEVFWRLSSFQCFYRVKRSDLIYIISWSSARGRSHYHELVITKKTSWFSGLVFFTIRWWNPSTFAAMHPEGTARRVSWPYIEDTSYLVTWLFLVPLFAYTLWQVLYFLIVNVLRRQRLLRDPEVMTSYRYFTYLFVQHKDASIIYYGIFS